MYRLRMMRRPSLILCTLLLSASACGVPVGSGAATSAAQASGAPSPTGIPPAFSSTAPAASAASPSQSPASTLRLPRSAHCGEVITTDLTLANDLACTTDALVAGADGITIDLGGKTLKGPGMGPQTWPSPQLDSVGVRVEGRTGVTVKNGTASDFSTGVYFDRVRDSVIEAIRTERNRYGLYIHNSDGNTIRKNHVATNIYGLHLQRANDNVVQGNQLVRQTYNSPGGYGIYLFASERNRIIENDIENNVNWGIWFSEARSNVTYHNNVAGNRPQVSDNTEGNVWHDAATKRGNYWGDYRGGDTNGDGIGDGGAYLILGPADVVDPYPFVERDGWKKTSRTIDMYTPPPARQPREIRLIALTADGTVRAARPGDARAEDTGLRASSVALQSDGHTLYALEGQRLAVWDARVGVTSAREVAIRDGVVAANRDGVSALVVSRSGAQQIDTTSGQSEFFAYAKQPNGIAPSYKHNHIFVAHDRGLDLFYLNLGGRTPYTIPLDGPAAGLTMNGSGTRVYLLIGDGGGSGVSPTSTLINVVDTEQYAVVDRITLPVRVNAAIAVGPREDRLYVGYAGGVLAIDLKDKRIAIRQEASFIGVVVDLAVSPNGDELYAALGGLDQGVAVLRTSDLTRANIIRLSELPTRILAAAY